MLKFKQFFYDQTKDCCLYILIWFSYHKKMFGSGTKTWRNEWYHKIVKSLKKSGLLIKGVSRTIKDEA